MQTTFLHLAASRGSPQVVQFLLRRGARVTDCMTAVLNARLAELPRRRADPVVKLNPAYREVCGILIAFGGEPHLIEVAASNEPSVDNRSDILDLLPEQSLDRCVVDSSSNLRPHCSTH